MSFRKFSATLSQSCEETGPHRGSSIGDVETPLTYAVDTIRSNQQFAILCEKKSGDEENELENTNFFSEVSREAVRGSVHLPQDLAGDFTDVGSNDKSFQNDGKTEQETNQLNVENILRMERIFTNGDVPLRPELLSTNTIYHKKPPYEERPMSVVTIFPDSEPATTESSIKQGFDSQIAVGHCDVPGASFSATQLWSVDSVCGSSITQNVLNRRNLDRLSCQLHFGTTALKPEFLTDNGFLNLEKTFEGVANETIASMCVEGDSELRGDFELQSDITVACDEGKKNNYSGDISEVSGKQVFVEKKTCSYSKSNDVSKSSVLTRDKRQKKRLGNLCSTEKYGHCKISRNMPTNRLSFFSFPEECQKQECETVSSMFLTKCCCKNAFKICGKAAQVSEDMQLGKSRCDNDYEKKAGLGFGLCDIFNVLNKLLEQITDIKRHINLCEEKMEEITAKTEKKLFKIDTQIAELIERCRVSPCFGDNVFTQALKDEIIQSFREHMDELLQKMTDQDKLACSAITQPYMSRDQICGEIVWIEGSFSAKDIHKMGKMRLIVKICFPNMHCEVLLSISCNATVSMCKHEILRRLSHQGLNNGTLCYNNMFLFYGLAVLFDDDQLADVLDPAFQSTATGNNVLTLTLSTFPLNATCSACNTQFCTITKVSQQNEKNGFIMSGFDTRLTSSVTTASMNNYIRDNADNNNGSDAVCILPHSKTKQGAALRLTQATDMSLQEGHLGVLCPEATSELFQSESLHRELVCRLERSERDKLFNDEKTHRGAILRNTLNLNRFLLLRHTMRSPLEAHCSLARDALKQLDVALQPGTPLEKMTAVYNATQAIVQRIVTKYDAARDNSATALSELKENTVEVIKELCAKMCQLRIPANMMRRAESLKNDAERAVILAPSSTQEELDAVYRALTEFCSVFDLKK